MIYREKDRNHLKFIISKL